MGAVEAELGSCQQISRASTSSPRISLASSDSTSAILRRTSARYALVISGETSKAANESSRQFGTNLRREIIASRKISSDGAICLMSSRLKHGTDEVYNSTSQIPQLL